MKNKEDNLQELANAVLESIEDGGDLYDEYQKRYSDFIGYSIEALRSLFERQVEDMRDYAKPNDLDWAELFGKINNKRHNILISQPALATIEDLRVWIASNEESAYQCFVSAVPTPPSC